MRNRRRNRLGKDRVKFEPPSDPWWVPIASGLPDIDYNKWGQRFGTAGSIGLTVSGVGGAANAVRIGATSIGRTVVRGVATAF